MSPSLRARHVCIAFMLASACAAAPFAQAQIYKWVDAQGRTHYGERPADAGTAPATRVKVSVSPAVAAPAPATARPVAAAPAAPAASAPKKRTRSLSGGREDGTDASRCALARDVLSGAVHRRNGAPVDAYDRQVAQSDIQIYCGGR